MFSRPPSHRHRHRSSATSALVTAVSLRGKAGHDERAPLRLEAVDRATYPAPQSPGPRSAPLAVPIRTSAGTRRHWSSRRALSARA